MIFTETRLKGAFVVELEPREDERGFFARSFCQKEFEARGLKPVIAQSGLARNHKKGTLRGMHFQFPPEAEIKLVRCVHGAILDVIVDLRPESATYLQHVAVELDGGSLRALYVPERFAHGYQSLSDDSVVSYELGAFYAPGAEGGLLHDDTALGIAWPLPVTAISARDRSFQPLAASEAELRRRMAPPRRAPTGQRQDTRVAI
ncbi:MAG: dTDP-4-dehydrorhamnose 3,5-epimerase family protein [Methyloceanibacter sp.]